MRRRSSVQSVAREGSTMTGRRIPHVSGMARVLLHCRRRTERASLWNWESSKTVRIQSSSKMGFACAETQARRARPATSLTRMSEKPNAQTIRAAMASLLKVGEAATASTKTKGIAEELELAAFSCTGLHRVAALPSVAECHAGSSSARNGSASEARIAAAHTWCRKAEEPRCRAITVIHAQARRMVALAQHAIKKVSAGSELASVLMVSSPFSLLP